MGYESEANLLNFAIEHGIINEAFLKEQVEMQKKKELLEKHTHSIYQGAEGYWYTYIEDRGKRKRIKAVTKEALENKICKFLKQKADDPTIKEIYELWIQDKLRHGEISPATKDRYDIDFRKYFTDTEQMGIKSTDERWIEDFVKNAIFQYKMSPKNFSNFRTLLYGIFKYAKKYGYVNFSITYAVKDIEISPKAFTKKVKRATDQVYLPEEKEAMENYLIQNQDIVNLGLLFMFKTGVRIGELSTLKREDVIDNYAVAIGATETRYKDSEKKVHYDVKESPKSEAGYRYAILPEQYEWILARIMETRPCRKYLSARKDGSRIKTYSFRRRLNYLCTTKVPMEVPKSPHKIRKTYGTILIDGNVKESTITNTMGHTDIGCTKEHYYYDRRKLEEKRRELGNLDEL